jgi:hypothetical protein
MVMTDLLKGQLPYRNDRMPNTWVPPEIFRIVMLEKMCLVRLTLLEQLKVLEDRGARRSVRNIGSSLGDGQRNIF